MTSSRRKRSSVSQPQAAVIEPLDPRLILDAPLALASGGLVLADPTPDELLVPATFATPSPASVNPPPVASIANAAPVGNATAAGADNELALTTSSCCGTAMVSMICLGSISEALDGTSTSYFRFNANGCGTPPPSSVTVGFTLGGTATPDVDYTSALTSRSVTIPMTYIGGGTSVGSKDVAYTVIRELVDEVSSETVDVTITSASTDTGAAVTIANPFAEGAVASGDYTFPHKVFEGRQGGGHDEASASPTKIGEFVTSVGVDDVGWPIRDRSIGIQVYTEADHVPVVGHEVTLVRSNGPTESGVVKVVDGGVEKDEVKATTDNAGVAWFTIRYKQGQANDAQRLEAWTLNNDGEKQQGFIVAKIVN